MLEHMNRREYGIEILQLAGEATDSPGQLLPGLADLLRGGATRIILNLRGVTYVNSAGLSAFIDSYRTAVQRGATVALCALQPQVLKVFKLARVDVFLPIYSTEDQAYNHFGAAQGNEAALPRERIMVLEPGSDLHTELVRVLDLTKEAINYQLQHAHAPGDAMTSLRQQPAQVLLVDVRIPARELLPMFAVMRQSASLGAISVLVAAREEDLEDADWLIRNGTDDVIRRPLSHLEVPSRLRTAFALHYALRQIPAPPRPGTTSRNPVEPYPTLR